MPKRKQSKKYVHVVTKETPVPTHLFLTKKEYNRLSRKAPKRFQKWRY
jgi:hypothetical protein